MRRGSICSTSQVAVERAFSSVSDCVYYQLLPRKFLNIYIFSFDN